MQDLLLDAGGDAPSWLISLIKDFSSKQELEKSNTADTLAHIKEVRILVMYQ